MAEKSTNKVVFGDKTLIDLTNDTVTPQTLMEGVTAHDASGQLISGEVKNLGFSLINGVVNQTYEDGT